MPKPSFECSQCGATELETERPGRVRCAYCGSVYRYEVRGPTVVVQKRGNIVMGRGSKVTVRGGLEVGEDATVRVDGELTLLERAPEEVVASARLKLATEAG